MADEETWGSRLVRAATCEPAFFAEVATDAGSTRGALHVVFGVALASGIGHLPAGGLPGFFLGGVRWLCAWVVCLLTVHLGALLLGRRSDLGRLFRCLGYASVPFALGALEWLPLLGALVWLAKWVFGFFTFRTGTREALELDDSWASLLCAGGLALAAVTLRLL